ncbi:Transcriptional regulator, AbiEi antitoxin, Type IV TA system [Geodermatophilus saharensis]|uniref:Transcriptional regulator, AbiEi antitoxin, Type IV TA system n=1 Tax=Geodermatophilus saharensis TaxID=1137994 RepID=A0A239AA50_9ACTN|nr:Transcriptional regulator, AbiEi antitoxin, Type IV TA system [Geodermatophilus saharensis]
MFRGSAQVAAGHLTKGQLRSAAWQRLFRDVYACSSVALTHEVRAGAAALLLLPGAVVCGRSAAVLWGVDAAGPDDDVEVTVPPGSPACTVPGVRVRRWALLPDQITTRRGIPVTVPATTAVDIGRAPVPLAESVVLVDALVACGATELAAVRTAAAAATGSGCRRARRVADLADGLAGSPQETRLRLLLHASRLPRPVAQHTVLDANGDFVARVDFAWPAKRLAVEYEGRWHGRPQHVASDRARLNRLTAAGWRVVFVTAEDLRDPDLVVARLAALLLG